jgi:hypothetical protein
VIVITLAGDSRRFFQEGFTEVKYKLPFRGQTIIESILGYIPRDLKVLVVTNEKYNDVPFCKKLLKKMEFKNYKVVEIQSTKGQLETVIHGLRQSIDFFNTEENLTVYNGDTIRKSTTWDGFKGDGYIEVFEAEGSHWSFVDKLGKVNQVAEKHRISNYCSSGLYYFNRIDLLLNNYDDYKMKGVNENELFVAPFYNYLIQNNFEIFSSKLSVDSFIFCGTPLEYHKSLLTLDEEK